MKVKTWFHFRMHSRLQITMGKKKKGKKKQFLEGHSPPQSKSWLTQTTDLHHLPGKNILFSRWKPGRGSRGQAGHGTDIPLQPCTRAPGLPQHQEHAALLLNSHTGKKQGWQSACIPPGSWFALRRSWALYKVS